MLPELYRYAQSHRIAAKVGYKERRVKAYVNFLSSGGPPAILEALTKTTYAPDLGSMANGTTKCNPLVEKAAYVLNLFDPDEPKEGNTPVKHRFFLSSLESAAAYEPRLALCRAALDDEATLTTLREALLAVKLKPGDPIGIMVDGEPMEQSERLFDWWTEFRASLDERASSEMRCLITGEPARPWRTVTKINGLRSVGGHTSGDALLCFDKDAFTSYGLKQGENACVSEEAMTAVNRALNALIARAPRLAGAKYVYFYREPVAPDEDPMPLVFGDFMAGGGAESAVPDGEADSEDEIPDEAEAADEEEGTDEAETAAEEDAQADAEAEDAEAAGERRLREDVAIQAAKALLESIRLGRRPDLLTNRYYIMPLSGAGGRVMVRGWMEGDFRTLCENIRTWFDDLRIVSAYGRGTTRPPKLFALCIRLLKPQKGGRKIGERIDGELSAVVPRILYAILNNGPLPDTVASRALNYIRSRLLAADDGDASGERTMDAPACELLKAWLNRTIRTQGGSQFMNEELNPAYQGVAYQLGRLMAVYAAVQTDALGSDLGAGVLQRYYASASASPALVIGKLAQLSQHHLSKLSNVGGAGRAIRYSKMLQDIYAQIRQAIPTTLSLKEQSEFALGYYQQRAALFAPRARQDAGETETEETAEEMPETETE